MRKFFSVFFRGLYPILIYLALTILVEYAFFGLFSIIGIMRGTGVPSVDFIFDNGLIITGIAAVINIPIGVWLYKRDEVLLGQNCVDQYRAVPKEIYLSSFFGAAGLSILGNIFVQLTFANYNDVDYSTVNNVIYGANKLVTLILVGIIVPITEELIFRGLVYKRIRKAYGALAAIILSAVAFGLFHGNLTQGVYATILGVVLAWGYEQTESMVVPILMHQGANTLSVFLAFSAMTAKPILIIAILQIAIACVIIMVFMIYLLSKYKKMKPREEIPYEAFKHISPLL